MFGKRELEDLRNENLSYLSQLYQAICMTAEISHYRRFANIFCYDLYGLRSDQFKLVKISLSWFCVIFNVFCSMLITMLYISERNTNRIVFLIVFINLSLSLPLFSFKLSMYHQHLSYIFHPPLILKHTK